MDKFIWDSGISNVRKHCSASILAVVTTILAALSMQTIEEQLSAKHTDLVFAEGQGSGPPLGCGNVSVTGGWILLEDWYCSSALVEYDCVETHRGNESCVGRHFCKQWSLPKMVHFLRTGTRQLYFLQLKQFFVRFADHQYLLEETVL